MPALDVVGGVASVDRHLGVDVPWTNRELGRRDPRDVALGVAVHHVETGCVNELRVGLERLEAWLSREAVKRLVDAVFGVLGERPPHRQAVLQQRAVVRRAHLEDHVRFAGHLDGLEPQIQGKPLPVVQVGVAFQGLPVQVDLVVHEHRGAPRVLARVPDDREWNAPNVVAVILEIRGHHVGLVPHRGGRVGHVGVVAEQHFTRRRPVAAQHPSVASQPLRHGTDLVQPMHGRGQPRNVLGTHVAGDVLKPCLAPSQVRHQRGIQLVVHPIQDGLGLQVNGEGVRHEARGAIHVVHVKGLRLRVDQPVFQRQLAFFDEGVDAVEVGRHGGQDVRIGLPVHLVHGAGRRFPHAQRPKVFVVLHHVWPEQRRQLPGPGPAQQIHLPQPLHGMHVAQGMHGVRLRLGVDVRHPQVVEQHLDLRLHTIHSEVKPVVRGDGLHRDEHEGNQHGNHDGKDAKDVFHGRDR